MDALSALGFAIGALVLVFAAIIAGLSVRFYLGRRQVDRMWAARHPAPLKETGAVKQLTILPLILQ
jgi:hypothetical protein